MRGARAVILAGVSAALAGCGSGPERAAPVAPVPQPAPRPGLGAVLAPDGSCTGPAPRAAAAIAPGIAECDLVVIKGRPPTDVLVGESGRGQREVQVLYAEPGGRELYFFIDNRLDRIVR
ncbi:MAG: hypothetical protein K2X71_07600 [Methylobacterium sp.]|uniref:hypothetical protein n=1 Tax=Methylobacterium sp. TaxID=409 RepID=UPI002587BD0F|nr:hypothetical protein [Methylobacterium sp.]MBY0295885.1 hypothetical protein [Methylobacterium sp.]